MPCCGAGWPAATGCPKLSRRPTNERPLPGASRPFVRMKSWCLESKQSRRRWSFLNGQWSVVRSQASVERSERETINQWLLTTDSGFRFNSVHLGVGEAVDALGNAGQKSLVHVVFHSGP